MASHPPPHEPSSNSNKQGWGEHEEIHVSTGGVQAYTDDDADCESRRPLLLGTPASAECYSVSAAVLPYAYSHPSPPRPILLSYQPYLSQLVPRAPSVNQFFFPALGGLLYGYDIGATSGATISLKSSTFSGTTWYNLSSVQTGLVITGQPSVLYYAATIFQSAGFSGASDATRVSILLGLLKLIMTGVAVLVVDRLGRRPLLIGGVSGILSFGPIGWLMISEVFPLRLRGRGLSVAVLVNFASNALVTFAFSPLEDLIGTGLLFCGFGVIAVASLVFIFWIVPETKGLTLEEIEASL
nr:unnamed protein product [Digitaria exilis]